jgi:ankyrin repeat protein
MKTFQAVYYTRFLIRLILKIFLTKNSQAALWDNTHLLIDLLEGGQQAFLNSQDSWGRTPLHAAAINENSGCLSILLNAGADPNIRCGPRGDKKVCFAQKSIVHKVL